LMAYKSNKAFGNTGKIFYYTFPNNIWEYLIHFFWHSFLYLWSSF
jgi:hypothetical protein